jgi:acylaminoacyl-peptidase
MDDGSVYSSFVSYSTTKSKGNFASLSKNGNPPLLLNFIENVRDLDENRQRSFISSYYFDPSNNQYEKIETPLIESSKVLIFSQSPSMNRSITIRNVEKKMILELTNKHGAALRIDTSKIHGDVIADSWFGGVSWTTDESYFAYVCKALDETRQSNFGYDAPAKSSTVTDTTSPSVSKYEYVEDWGERFVGLSSLRIAIVNTDTGKISLLPDFHGGNATNGQPQFRPGIRSKYELAYTSWSNLPRKLGMVYCYQRKCSICYTDITKYLISGDIATVTNRCLTSGLVCARSPRFNPSGKLLVFVSRKDQMQTHNGCMQMSIIRHVNDVVDESSMVETLIDLVDVPVADSFPGLFCDQLPPRCFSTDNSIVYFSSVWGSRDVLLSVSLSSGQVSKLLDGPVGCFFDKAEGESSPADCSMNLLDIHDNYLLLTVSDPIHLQQGLVFNILTKQAYNFGGLMRSAPVSLKPVNPAIVDKYFSSMRFKVFKHITDGVPFESILLYPVRREPTNGSSVIPIILVPHGGPHSCITCAFYSSYAYLASQLNAAVLFVNFRGSTGYGEASIKSLPSHIGRNDVDDCMLCLNHALSVRISEDGTCTNYISFDRNRVAVVGGSHGGFLAAHLIGQYPDTFKVACMRNPVTHLPSMVGVSDIPDWCWVEAGQPYDFNRYDLPSEAQMTQMSVVSPSKYLHQVKTPTLICLGGKDRRVPPTQGLDYYHLLKARGIECKLMIYPDDNHALDSPTIEAEHWIAINNWIASHL